MRTTRLILLAAATAMLASCGDSQPHDPIDETYSTYPPIPTYAGADGFAISGNGMNAASFTSDSSASLVAEQAPLIFTSIRQDGLLRGGRASVEIAITHPVALGTFRWSDDSLSRSEVAITIPTDGAWTYRSMEGSTTITRLGAVGERIEGTYRGMMLARGNPLPVSVAGAFSAIRRN